MNDLAADSMNRSLRLIGACLAHETVRRERVAVERKFNACERPGEVTVLRHQLHALRDREADLLGIITSGEL